MDKRAARKLGNRDEVYVRVFGLHNDLDHGYVVGTPWETKDGVFVDVDIPDTGEFIRGAHG